MEPAKPKVELFFLALRHYHHGREVDAVIDLINSEVARILDEANFRQEEEILFRCRYCGPYRLSLEECAEELNVSLSTAKRINARVKQKIMRLN